MATAFAHALSVLERAGARLVHARFPEFEEILVANAKGGFAASEAYAWHRGLLAGKGDGYDPRIRVRIARGERMSAADYLDVVAARARLVASFDARTREYDCVVMPTVPIVPPAVADLDDEQEYNRVNMLILRNTALGNFLDRCAISLPCHGAGEAPVGLMLMGETLGDARLFRIAAGWRPRWRGRWPRGGRSGWGQDWRKQPGALAFTQRLGWLRWWVCLLRALAEVGARLQRGHPKCGKWPARPIGSCGGLGRPGGCHLHPHVMAGLDPAIYPQLSVRGWPGQARP